MLLHSQEEQKCCRKRRGTGEVSERATRSGWELSLSRAHFQKQTTSSMEAIYNQLHIPLPSRREATGPVLWFLLIT